jgi:hypothetical protein
MNLFKGNISSVALILKHLAGNLASAPWVKNKKFGDMYFLNCLGSVTFWCGNGSADPTPYLPVLRIRDVYPGSRIRLFTIPDPGSELSPSRIPDPGSSSKNLSILTPKKAKKWFLS